MPGIWEFSTQVNSTQNLCGQIVGKKPRKTCSAKVQKVGKKQSEGAFLDFDDNLWSKSSIHTLCGPPGPIVDASVKRERIRNRFDSVLWLSKTPIRKF